MLFCLWTRHAPYEKLGHIALEYRTVGQWFTYVHTINNPERTSRMLRNEEYEALSNEAIATRMILNTLESFKMQYCFTLSEDDDDFFELEKDMFEESLLKTLNHHQSYFQILVPDWNIANEYQAVRKAIEKIDFELLEKRASESEGQIEMPEEVCAVEQLCHTIIQRIVHKLHAPENTGKYLQLRMMNSLSASESMQFFSKPSFSEIPGFTEFSKMCVPMFTP